jgi:hypothetical protein
MVNNSYHRVMTPEFKAALVSINRAIAAELVEHRSDRWFPDASQARKGEYSAAELDKRRQADREYQARFKAKKLAAATQP